MPLTDTEIRAAKPKQKPYKLFDERGLFVLVKPSGVRLWRFKYVLAGREKLISLGDYQRRVDVVEFIAIARALQTDPRKLFDSIM
jgi:hypothetical protein